MKKKKPIECDQNCHMCSNCEYICEGDYICGVSMEIVIADWHPTEQYFSCGGKEFERL